MDNATQINLRIASQRDTLDSFKALVVPYLTTKTFPQLKAVSVSLPEIFAALILAYPSATQAFSDAELLSLLDQIFATDKTRLDQGMNLSLTTVLAPEIISHILTDRPSLLNPQVKKQLVALVAAKQSQQKIFLSGYNTPAQNGMPPMGKEATKMRREAIELLKQTLATLISQKKKKGGSTALKSTSRQASAAPAPAPVPVSKPRPRQTVPSTPTAQDVAKEINRIAMEYEQVPNSAYVPIPVLRLTGPPDTLREIYSLLTDSGKNIMLNSLPDLANIIPEQVMQQDLIELLKRLYWYFFFSDDIEFQDRDKGLTFLKVVGVRPEFLQSAQVIKLLKDLEQLAGNPQLSEWFTEVRKAGYAAQPQIPPQPSPPAPVTAPPPAPAAVDPYIKDMANQIEKIALEYEQVPTPLGVNISIPKLDLTALDGNWETLSQIYWLLSSSAKNVMLYNIPKLAIYLSQYEDFKWDLHFLVRKFADYFENYNHIQDRDRGLTFLKVLEDVPFVLDTYQVQKALQHPKGLVQTVPDPDLVRWLEVVQQPRPMPQWYTELGGRRSRKMRKQTTAKSARRHTKKRTTKQGVVNTRRRRR